MRTRLLLPALITVALLGTAVVSVSPVAAAAPSVGVVSSFDTVQPFEPAPASSLASLRALRGEFESFQIVTEAAPGAAVSITGVQPSVLAGPGAATIPSSAFTIYEERYTTIHTPSDQEGLDEDPSLPASQRGWCRFFTHVANPTCGIPVDANLENTTWKCTTSQPDPLQCRIPDPLVPLVDPWYGETRNVLPIQIPAGENRALWVDLLVPRTAAPGTYTGTVTLDLSDGSHPAVSVTVEVIDALLPAYGEDPAVDLTAGIRASTTPWCIAMSACGLGWDDKYEAYSVFLRSALENRLPITTVQLGNLANATERAAFADWVAPFFDGAALPAAVTPHRLPYRQDVVLLDRNPSSTDWANLKVVATTHGFEDAVRFYCDEVMNNQATFVSDCANPYVANAVSGWGAGLGVALIGDIAQWNQAVTWAPANVVTTLANAEILIPLMSRVDSKTAASARPLYDSWLTGDRQLWMYDSNASLGSDGEGGVSGLGEWTPHQYWNGWPGIGGVDQPATSEAALGLLSYAYDTTGRFYYEAFSRLPHAWTDCAGATYGNCLYYEGGHGDGTLFYPGTPARIGGTHGIPVESIRLKRHRDGAEDHVIARLLESGCGGECVAVARQDLLDIIGGPDATAPGAALFTEMSTTSVGAPAYDAARDDILDLLVPTAVPAQTRIAFTSDRAGSRDIWTMNEDGSDPTNLTGGAAWAASAEQFAAWSPDGTRLAFTSNRAGDNDIWVMNIDGSGAVNLTAGTGASESKPAWGATTFGDIAYVRTVGGNSDVWAMNADGSGQHLLVGGAGAQIDPAFSSLTTSYVYVRDTSVGYSNVDIMRVVTAPPATAVVDDAAVHDTPDLANGNGKAMAHSQYVAGGSYDIVVDHDITAGPAGVNITAAATATHEYQPTWSPADDRLAFVSNSADGALGTPAADLEIWRAATDGTGVVQLTANTSYDADPDWQPKLPVHVIRPFGVVVTEGDAGSQVANVIVYLETPSLTPVTVDWATAETAHPATAKYGSDWLQASGTLTIPAGATEATVPVTILGDTVDEPPALYGEWGPVAFGNPSSNASIWPGFYGLALVIILDDD